MGGQLAAEHRREASIGAKTYLELTFVRCDAPCAGKRKFPKITQNPNKFAKNRLFIRFNGDPDGETAARRSGSLG